MSSRDNETSPRDLLLVVGISDSTLGLDRLVKAPLYARAGIPEYWIIDLTARRLIVHREPTSGEYQNVQVYAESEPASPLAAPTAQLLLSDILPPVDE